MDEAEKIAAGARFELRHLQEREHLLGAVLKGIERFDEVAAVVRRSHSREEIRDSLMKLLDVDEYQAMAVADIQVQALSGRRLQQLSGEHDDVLTGIAELESVLESPTKLVGTPRGEELAKLSDR